MRLHNCPTGMRRRVGGIVEFPLRDGDARTIRGHYRRMRRRGMSELMARWITIDLLKIGRWSR